MKRVSLIIILFLSLIACNKSEKEKEVEVVKPKPPVVEFGFVLDKFDVVYDTVSGGDTFGGILQKQNLEGKQVYDIVQKVKDTFDVRLIRKGKPYLMLRSKDSLKKLQVFVYQPDQYSYYVIDLRDSIVAHKKVKPITIKRRIIATAINGSLSETLSNAGVDASLANQLGDIFAYSVDFFKIQKGDKFGVIFNERFINDTVYAGVESLEASFFEYKGTKIYAFPFKQDSTLRKIDFYDEEGRVLKNMFLKAPLKFSRISSRFSPRRFHPVQQRFKAHKGTDYAAPHGTPIMSTASGIVERAGYTAGNGNYVKVKHDRTFSTQYLHMSKILVRNGQRVSQGQVIGKVGSTGLATGPHVCYRFWKNGVQVDALRQKLPSAIPMDAKQKPRYLAYISPLKIELDSIANVKFKNDVAKK